MWMSFRTSGVKIGLRPSRVRLRGLSLADVAAELVVAIGRRHSTSFLSEGSRLS